MSQLKAPTIELIWDDDCPNVDLAKSRLQAACKRLDMDLDWTGWNTDDPQAPSYTNDYGSPTILVDGTDVTGESSPSSGDCCRIYSTDEGSFDRAPSTECIVKAIQQALDRP